MSTPEEHFQRLKTKYGKSFDELLEYLKELDEKRVHGPLRKEMAKKKFPEIEKDDITFVLFYGRW